jgi:hypothetical protein
MLHFITGRRLRVDPHFTIYDGYGEAANIVGEWIERAPAGKVEPGVMPMACQDAVLHAAPVQRKPHMRTPVVYRVHLFIVKEDGYGMSCAGCHHAAAFPQLVYAPNTDLSFNRCSHDDNLLD